MARRWTGPAGTPEAPAGEPLSGDAAGQVGESLAPALVATGILIFIIHIGLGVVHYDALASGGLLDTDAYTRLVRVLNLWRSGDWFDPVLERVSPPEGLISHWTRPMDVVLIAGALALSPVLGFEQGLHWWGVVVAPLLHLAAALAMVWAVRALMRPDHVWLAGILFAIQPGLVGYLTLGRPDHHGLLILAAVLYLGAGLRLLVGQGGARNAWIMGLIGAFGVWVGVQFLPLLVLPLVLLGIHWLAGEDCAARDARRLSAGLVLGTAVALLIERGWQRIPVQDFDTLSIAHFLLFALTLGFWAALEVLQTRWGRPLGPAGRAAVAALGAGLVLGLLLLLAPAFFASPLAEVDPLYRAKRLVLINELQPALLTAADGSLTWAGSVARPIFWLGIALPTVPWILHRLGSGSPSERRLYRLLGLGVAVYLPLALYQLRWTPDAALFLAPAYAALAATLVDRLIRGIRPKLVPVARPLVVTALTLWVLLPLAWNETDANAGEPDTAATTCRPAELAGWLGDPEGAGRARQYVLIYPDDAPTILYRTPHSVTAIPNHRLQPGFTAAYRIMTATDFAEAERLLRARGIDLIATCPRPGEDRLYDAAEEAPTLYRALKEGRPPAFLDRIGPSEMEVGGYRVYRVEDGPAQ